ncbi:MAG: HPr family phosphocarrier protein [Gammaproteobacteria bacterium]|nr:HPr family phosphocarrier protein [Gammaproteobacteria bacterium]
MIRKQIDIINKLGLHARAAAKFVTCASHYKSHINLDHDGHEVNGKSIMGVMMLAAAQGTTLTLSIDGADEEPAMAALEELVKDRFGEDS